MKFNSIVFSLLFLIITISTLSHGYADSFIKIEMDKTNWEFGDFLFYVIKVSDITEDNAIIFIRDESGKKFGPPPLQFTQLENNIPSIYPLHPDLGFKEGKYYIDVEYGSHKDSIEFNITDTGKAIIPIGIRASTMHWITQDFPDEFFAKEVRTLINEGTVAIPENFKYNASNEFKFPNWIKTNTVVWWLSGEISDKEFTQALEYLIKIKSIII